MMEGGIELAKYSKILVKVLNLVFSAELDDDEAERQRRIDAARIDAESRRSTQA
jgi:hypothetical protein